MLDGLLGRSGFSSKCKSLIKPTRTRIEVLRRRAEAKQRFLKEDLAKLLANGLDVNAYGRTEDFIAGLNMLSCYNFLDQSCEYILKQLSVMQKQGQCPEECRETVASLMFAAARFSDLPELRDLRDVFQDRYGNGLECYVNQAFVEKLASKPPIVEKRIKLLQDIATELTIQWDSKGFKERMDKPSTLDQDQGRKLGPSSVADENYKVQNGNNVFRKSDQRSKEKIEHIHEGPRLNNDGNGNVRRKEVLDIPFVGKEERHAQDQAMKLGSLKGIDDKYKVPNGNFVFKKHDQHPKERTEHSREGPTLHNHDKYMVPNGNDVFRKNDQSSKERIEHPLEGPTLHHHDKYRVPNGNDFFRKNDQSSKERIEDSHEGQTLHNHDKYRVPNGNDVFRKNDRSSKERIKNSHEGPTLHTPDKYRVPNGNDVFLKSDQISKERIEDSHEGPTLHNHDKYRVPNGNDVYRKNDKRSRERIEYSHEGSTLHNHDKYRVPNGNDVYRKNDQRFKERIEDSPEGPTLHNHDKYRVPNGHDLFRKRYQSSKEKIEDSHEGPTLHDHDMYRVPNVNDIHRKNERIEEEPIRVKPCSNASLPPPYVKPNLPPPYTKPNNHHEPSAADRHSSGDLPPLDQPNSDRRKKERNEHRHYQNNTPIPILPLPKPRSIRRKHSKSSSSHDDVGSSEDSSRIVKRISSSRRKERKGLQILFDDDEHYYHHRKTDEEEKMMDKLLLHYSKKPSSYFDKKSRKKKSKSPDESETFTPPTRSISLPHESEPKKVYARANSFQPDNQAPHVHPKLPDYDDLAARFAALRGR